MSKGGLRIHRYFDLSKPGEPIGDGIALTSMAHPPGLIDKMADAIRSGRLSLKGISKRTYYRRLARQAKASKGEME